MKETHHPGIDPVAADNLDLLAQSESQDRPISDLYRDGLPTTVVLDVEGGTIEIEHSGEPDKKGFTVKASDDPSLKPGSYIVIDGATIGGSFVKAGILAPNTRLGFRLLKVNRCVFGDETSGQTITHETFDFFDKHGMASIDENGNPVLGYFDPTPRATGFIAHARTERITDDGVETEGLF